MLHRHARRLVLAAGFLAMVTGPTAVLAKTLNIVAFGDSLTAGYELPADAAFPAVLEKNLRAAGLDVSIANAGVSGDTTAGGLERLDWSVPDGTDGVILELGANDMLRGTDPSQPRKNLDAIIKRLRDRNIAVFLAGMLASPSLGQAYTAEFNAIYPDLAKTYGLPLYPFFLQGVTGQSKLQLTDGMHPNAEGVALVVKSILPSVEAWIRGLPARS